VTWHRHLFALCQHDGYEDPRRARTFRLAVYDLGWLAADNHRRAIPG